MPCPHLFEHDLNLEYVTWEIRTLFIGTFNPGWGLENNNAQWFYGRTARNDFWRILPTIHIGHGLIPGTPQIWKQFCELNHIAITDIIACLDNADENNPAHVEMVNGFQDNQLGNFDITTTNIPAILEANPTIQQVCITRSSMTEPWSTLFEPTIDWIENHPERGIQLRLLRSPSRGARKGVVGNFTDYIANHWQQVGNYEIL